MTALDRSGAVDFLPLSHSMLKGGLLAGSFAEAFSIEVPLTISHSLFSLGQPGKKQNVSLSSLAQSSVATHSKQVKQRGLIASVR